MRAETHEASRAREVRFWSQPLSLQPDTDRQRQKKRKGTPRASAIRRVGVKLSHYISVELRGAAGRLYHLGRACVLRIHETDGPAHLRREAVDCSARGKSSVARYDRHHQLHAAAARRPGHGTKRRFPTCPRSFRHGWWLRVWQDSSEIVAPDGDSD